MGGEPTWDETEEVVDTPASEPSWDETESVDSAQSSEIPTVQLSDHNEIIPPADVNGESDSLMDMPRAEGTINVPVGGKAGLDQQVQEDFVLQQQEKTKQDVASSKSAIRDLIFNQYKDSDLNDPNLQQDISNLLNPDNNPSYLGSVLPDDAKMELANYASSLAEEKPNIIKYSDKVEKNPEDVESLNGLADSYNRTGDLEQSLSLYTKANAVKENDQSLQGLGSVYLQSGQLDEAKKSFTEATKINPDNIFSQNNIAYIESKQGNFTESDAALKSISEKYPDYPWPYALSSFNKQQQGDLVGAKADDAAYKLKKYFEGMPELSEDAGIESKIPKKDPNHVDASMAERVGNIFQFVKDVEVDAILGIGQGVKDAVDALGVNKYTDPIGHYIGFINGVATAAFSTAMGATPEGAAMNVTFHAMPEEFQRAMFQPIDVLLSLTPEEREELSKNKKLWLDLGNTLASIGIFKAVHGSASVKEVNKFSDRIPTTKELEQMKRDLGNTTLADVQKAQEVWNAIPGELEAEVKTDIVPLVAKRVKLETDSKKSGAFKNYYELELEKVDQQINDKLGIKVEEDAPKEKKSPAKKESEKVESAKVEVQEKPEVSNVDHEEYSDLKAMKDSDIPLNAEEEARLSELEKNIKDEDVKPNVRDESYINPDRVLNYTSDSKNLDGLTNDLIGKLKEVGFEANNFSTSNTDYGVSNYVIAKDPAGNSFKFRVSDHSVENINRIANEYHITNKTIGKEIYKAEKLAFPERFEEKDVTYNIGGHEQEFKVKERKNINTDTPSEQEQPINSTDNGKTEIEEQSSEAERQSEDVLSTEPEVQESPVTQTDTTNPVVELQNSLSELIKENPSQFKKDGTPKANSRSDVKGNYRALTDMIESKSESPAPENVVPTTSEFMDKNIRAVHAGSEVKGKVIEESPERLIIKGDDGIIYPVKEEMILKDGESVADKFRSLAEKVRKGKLTGTAAHTPLSLAWNAAIEVAAKSIEAGAKLVEAAEQAIEHLKNSDWYKSLSPEKQKTWEDRLKKKIPQELDKSKEKKGIIETVLASEKTTEGLSDKIKEGDEMYTPLTNKEALANADKIIKANPEKARETVLSDSPLSAEKSAMAIRIIKHYEAAGEYDLAVKVLESYDKQLREAGRFIQAASMWNKLAPETILKFTKKEAKKIGVDIPADVQAEILKRSSEIDKMPEGPDKTKATIELMNYIADQLPLSNREILEAYRYTNMLSNPRSHIRNVYSNTFNTLITRPADMFMESTYDLFRHPFNAAARDMKYMAIPKYYKDVFAVFPRAYAGAMEAFRSGYLSDKVMETGFNNGNIEAIRRTKLNKALTLIPRFMEAQDKLFSILIGTGEKTRLMKNGMSEVDASTQAHTMAEKYLFREKLGSDTKTNGLFVKALDSAGQLLLAAKKYPYIGRAVGWFVPFITTPINIAKFGIEHSPLGFIPDNIKGKFSKAQLLNATAGSLVTVFAAMKAMNGETTWAAPRDKKEKESFYASGRKPYSVRVGDKWVPMTYFGPFMLSFGLAAAVKQYETDSPGSMTDSHAKKISHAILSISGQMFSQTPVAGVGGLFKFLEGEDDYANFQNLALITNQFIPAEGMIKYINTIIDPVYRKAGNYGEALMKDIPGLSTELDYYENPDGTPATRDPVNYVTPYDIGNENEMYSEILQERREELQKNASANAKKKAKKKG